MPEQSVSMMEVAWAKFDPQTGESLPLYVHLEDTAEVARNLFAVWLSSSQRALLAEVFGSEQSAHKLAIWLGASHDVGKSTSIFAMKAPACRSRMEDAGYIFPAPAPPRDEQRKYPHGLAGQRAVQGYLSSKIPDASERGGVRAARALAEVVGGHHGVFSGNAALRDIPFLLAAGEDPTWSRVREELLKRADAIAGIEDSEWGEILDRRIPETAQVLLNGFLIVCDWIASNQWYFPYRDSRTSSARALAAIERLGFSSGWRPQKVESPERYFRDRFSIDRAHPVQLAVADVAARLEEASLLLIEAPTGGGKTEMAFIAAEALAARFGLRGAAIVLPTRATANAMFGRVLAWLRAGEPGDVPLAVSLAHAQAQFDEQFRALFGREHHQPSHTYDEDRIDSKDRSAVVVNQWCNGRKRSVFADFVVGTIDQLLFMTLKAKHTTLRHLGFGGKVVIIDEIHAADDFMRTYLFRALQWLGAYGVPVIALSATLPPAQRRELLHAYRTGARRGSPTTTEDPDAEIVALAGAEDYPLVTTIGAERGQQTTPEPSARRIDYLLEEIEEEQLVDAVLRESEAGGCIAVICDTVKRAQQIYQALRERYVGEIALLHSRFTVESRNRREQQLVHRLGPGSASRPERMIVVATQVVESSLDVDFDLMFTDIAPIDLLIQRLGRLHRHPRSLEERPATMREARAVLTGGTGLLTGADLPVFDPGVRNVYGEAQLLRTVAALRRNCERVDARMIRVPEDVPGLIRDAYSEVLHSFPGWEERQQEAEVERVARARDQQERSGQYVLGAPGVGRIADWNRLAYSEAAEEQLGAAQVRDAELSLEVVLVQQREGVCYPVPWLPEQFVHRQVDSLSGIEDEELERIIATCTVSLPSWMTRGKGFEAVLEDLERSGIEGWQRSIWLRGMLPVILDEDLCAIVNGHRVRYDQEIGLIVEGRGDT